MLYHVYEMSHAAMTPLRAAAEAGQLFFRSPFNPVSYTVAGRTTAAALDVFQSATQRYGKPRFGLSHTSVNGKTVPVKERVVRRDTWCALKHFERDPAALRRAGTEQT